MKHLFIVNPVAGGRDRSRDVRAIVEAVFARRQGSYEIYTTRAPMDAVGKIRAEAALENELRVYACGGDGTLNECVNGAAKLPNVSLTHYPTGTGNDFLRMFGGERDRFRRMDELVDGEARPIDIMSACGRYAVNICSVGIDARIGTDVHKYSRIPLIGGAAGYVVSMLVNVVKGITTPLRVSCGESSWDEPIALVCACNGRYYGGGFNPVPEALPDDGLMDFLVVPDVSLATFARVVMPYAKGRYKDYPGLITHVRGTRMDIESDTEIVVNMDGEAVWAKSVSFEMHPGALNFVFPRNMEFFDSKTQQN